MKYTYFFQYDNSKLVLGMVGSMDVIVDVNISNPDDNETGVDKALVNKATSNKPPKVTVKEATKVISLVGIIFHFPYHVFKCSNFCCRKMLLLIQQCLPILLRLTTLSLSPFLRELRLHLCPPLCHR